MQELCCCCIYFENLRIQEKQKGAGSNCFFESSIVQLNKKHLRTNIGKQVFFVQVADYIEIIPQA